MKFSPRSHGFSNFEVTAWVLHFTPQLEATMVSSFRDHSPLLSCFQTSILCHFIGRGNSILLGGPLRQLFPCLNKDYVSL